MSFKFKSIVRRKELNQVINIVSGLPRSGTSMMMQMLDAGGMTIVTDNIRKADQNNLRGYYEFESVKQIADDSSWLNQCFGKAFKIVSPLLYQLTKDKKYKIIFLNREMAEIIKSQNVMLERLGQKGSDVSSQELAKKYKKHLSEV